MTKSRKLTLQEYVRSIGIDEFADRYGCSIYAARKYLWGQRKPLPSGDIARRLIEDSPLTWEGIYGGQV